MASNSVRRYNFIAEPDSALQCVICLDVAEDPRQHEECGRLLCRQCLERLGRGQPCPNCRRKHPQFFKDNKSNREINTLYVKCSNANSGCEWVGTVCTLEEHVATCEFTLVPCPKQCKDDNDEVKCFTRKDLDEHLKNDCPNRDYECQSKCGEKGMYAYITKVHDKTCKMKILPCPNAGCNTEIQRQQVSDHVNKCPHTVIPCKHKGIGCDTELKREDMAAHEQDDKLHLHMALETVNARESAINTLRKTVTVQQVAISTLQDTVRAQQIKLNSQRDKLSVDVDKNEDPGVFGLSGYQKRKETNEYFQFPPFYTHPRGYHMALKVHANGWGSGKGTHVSVHMPLLEGEYDAELKWPFVGKVTVMLLNQLEDANHHSRTILFKPPCSGRVGSSWGLREFIPHTALAHDPIRNTQYLKNDTLYFRIMEVGRV